jgi:isocitrate dehydrogenase kinase/phosphatase
MLLAGVAALAVLLPVLPGNGDEPKGSDKKIAQLMHRKLAGSQKVLEGLAVGNFKEISDNAKDLIEISKEAEWKVLKTEKYEIYSNDFRREAENLVKNAADKNLDAAALTYVELTLTCVRCHKHVREVRETSFEEILP